MLQYNIQCLKESGYDEIKKSITIQYNNILPNSYIMPTYMCVCVCILLYITKYNMYNTRWYYQISLAMGYIINLLFYYCKHNKKTNLE